MIFFTKRIGHILVSEQKQVFCFLLLERLLTVLHTTALLMVKSSPDTRQDTTTLSLILIINHNGYQRIGIFARFGYFQRYWEWTMDWCSG